ncbi:MAG: hypothetical protein QNJ94_23910 [Alphaproteobacteria bacterium]|nr:hypothetical protein [Alphaproteobacteria bacterium]
MSASNDLAFWAILTVAGYKVASLLVGLGFGYMGYRLFLAGIEHPAGDLEASSGSRSLKLSRAAPGTFFALFGAAVIAATIFQGFDVELPGVARDALGVLPEHPPMVTDETPR